MSALASSAALWDQIGIVIGGLAASITLGGLVVAIREYTARGRQARAEMFFALRARLQSEPLIDIAALIELESDERTRASAVHHLAQIELKDKRMYIGLFEEVSYALKWRLLDRKAAHYMFGYYALQLAESETFWDPEHGINAGSIYWGEFGVFAGKLERQRARLLRQTYGRDVPRLRPLPLDRFSRPMPPWRRWTNR